MLAKKSTIGIFSHNRHSFLLDYVSFLNDSGFGGTLIICDSSKKKCFDKFSEQFKLVKKNFNTKLFNKEKKQSDTISLSMCDTVKVIVENIDSEYFILTADDDLISPDSLEICEKFLDKYTTYQTASGDVVKFNNKKKYKDLFSFSRGLRIKKIVDLNDAELSARIQKFFDYFFHSMFSLTRKNTTKYFVPENYMQIEFPHFKFDFNVMFPQIILGKFKRLNVPLVFRREHEDNLGDKTPYISLKNALNSETFNNDKKLFKINMQKILTNIYHSKKKNIDQEQINKNSNLIINNFLNMKAQLNQKKNQNIFYKLIYVIKKKVLILLIFFSFTKYFKIMRKFWKNFSKLNIKQIKA